MSVAKHFLILFSSILQKVVHFMLCRLSIVLCSKAGEREGAGRGAKYLGPGLVRGEGEILVKRLVMGATVNRVGGS